MKKHGGLIYEKNNGILDFSANIHPSGIPLQVKQEMEQALSGISYYPDPECTRLRQSIAQKYNVSMEHILCANGAADLIFLLAFFLHPKKLLLPVPTFVEYEEAFSHISQDNIEIDFYEIPQDTFQLEENFIKKMEETVDLIILCNPNNPTGQLISSSLLFRILERAKQNNIFVLVDECFMDFVVEGERTSLLPYYRSYPNVFLLKSFTKMYGIPGVRLGYGICSNEQILKQIRAIMQSWPVNHIAQAAGIAACQMKGYEEESASMIAKNRSWLLEQLDLLGFDVWEGRANYLFFRVRGCKNLAEICIKQGICIRHCNNYRGIGNDYYRIAVRTKDENKQLIRVLREWKEGNGK